MKYIRLGVEWRMKEGEKKKRFGSFEKKQYLCRLEKL